MKSFADYYALASLHKGGERILKALLPKALSDEALIAKSDDEFLSNMSRRVFRAGLKHSMVDKKWPQFETLFHGFDPYFCAMLSEDDIDTFMQDSRIIRHRGKLKSIQHNAQFVREKAQEYGSFGHYLSAWGVSDTVDLWWQLKKQGKQLGGNSGPAFLRMVGKDTFLLTRDVVAVLINENVIDRSPTSKKDMYAAQEAFIYWHQQSGRSLCEISRVISCTATS